MNLSNLGSEIKSRSNYVIIYKMLKKNKWIKFFRPDM